MLNVLADAQEIPELDGCKVYDICRFKADDRPLQNKPCHPKAKIKQEEQVNQSPHMPLHDPSCQLAQQEGGKACKNALVVSVLSEHDFFPREIPSLEHHFFKW